MDEQDEEFVENFNNSTHTLKDGTAFTLSGDMLEKIIDYFEKESFKQVCDSVFNTFYSSISWNMSKSSFLKEKSLKLKKNSLYQVCFYKFWHLAVE